MIGLYLILTVNGCAVIAGVAAAFCILFGHWPFAVEIGAAMGACAYAYSMTTEMVGAIDKILERTRRERVR